MVMLCHHTPVELNERRTKSMHNKDENDQNVIFTQKSDDGNTTSWLFLDCCFSLSGTIESLGGGDEFK